MEDAGRSRLRDATSRSDLGPRVFVSTPNSSEARAFLRERRPDLAIARCKVILKREIFEIPRVGTFVMHPGICPGISQRARIFWALVNRDLDRVGMTLFEVDAGIDHRARLSSRTCDIDEVRETHTVIQHRAVIENLDESRLRIRARSVAANKCQGSTRRPPFRYMGAASPHEYFRWKGVLEKMLGIDMGTVSLLFHDVYAKDPRESGFASDAWDRDKLS